jgi:riboflavin kinase
MEPFTPKYYKKLMRNRIMDEMLLLLLQHGAHLRPVRITSSELGSQLGMSQQNASRRLLELERSGYVERKEGGLMLTKKGHAELVGLYSTLKVAFEGSKIEFVGTVVSGLGEGKYYLSMAGYSEQIKEKLGFVPYSGTLNLRLDEADLWKKQHMLGLDPVIIKGFSDEKRTYGDLFAYRCSVEGLDCAVLVPLRTHHGPDVLEIIAPWELKRKLKKKDGSRIRVVI